MKYELIIRFNSNRNISFSSSVHIAFQNAYVLHDQYQRDLSKWSENEEIKIFREYLRIPTVQPDPDYSKILLKTVSNWITE